jgi:uncharacterized protein YhaN
MMHLQQVEAVRYGGLEGSVLGPLQPGLNVVVGRNEAGKSTFTSLVRHVLYGFPRGRLNERLYQPATGDQRVGRLVFAEGDAKWVIERTEGAHGGEAVVYAPGGKEPDDAYLQEIVGGVGVGVFRTVFGFALEELSDLGSLGDIQARLYASTAGLGVNPHDVLGKLKNSADELWAPRARTKRIHVLNNELRAVREESRRLQELAERYRADREHRKEVAVGLETAEDALQAARLAEERLAANLGEGRRLEEKVRDEDAAASEHQRAAERAKREVASLVVDEELLARAEAVERMGARCELFRAEAEQLRRDEERLREVTADIERRITDMGEGWTLETANDINLDIELENRLYEEQERIREAQRERDDAARRASEARTEHEEARRSADACAREIRIAGRDGVAKEIGVRLETVDRLLALGATSQPAGAPWLPAIAAAVIAAAMVVVGFVLDDRLLAVAAAAPAALAVALVLRPLLMKRKVPSEVNSLLSVVGLDRTPTGAELMAMRGTLERCRRLWATEGDLGRISAAREAAAREAVDAFDQSWQHWLEWLKERRLKTPSNHPESVRRVLRLLRDIRARAEGRNELETAIARRRAVCEEFVEDALAIGAVAGDAKDPSFEEVAHGARSLLAHLVAARKNADTRRDAEAEIITAEERAREAAANAVAAREELAQMLEKADLGADATLADVEAALAVARRRTRELERDRGELLEERGTLDGLLQRNAEESTSARLRLVEAGLVERVAEALERYVVTSVAVQLVDRALEVYEAERQPAVIQRAQEVFSALTDGRYTRVTTPLGKFEPLVSGGDAPGKPPDRLSRATAEQLFLALRLSYVENLANAHPALPVLMDDVLVNFDDSRRRSAAKVIAEFAGRRQVVFFTCNVATAETFAQVAAEHARVDI